MTFLSLSHLTQAQTAITRALNATRDGDSLVVHRLTDIPLQPVGHDVVWDLSQASPEGGHTLFFTGDDSRAVATEGGTSWRTTLHGDTLLLTGFENRQCLMEIQKDMGENHNIIFFRRNRWFSCFFVLSLPKHERFYLS